MHARTLSGAASELGNDLKRLTRLVVEQLQDPELVGDSRLEQSIEVILDRLCVSIRLSKPVGLATWAMRESRRFGAAEATEIASAAAHVIAGEAARFELDHGRLLAYLEALKSEMSVAVASVSGDLLPPRSTFTESTESLLAMLGERDSMTCCHSRATGEWTRRLCEAMGLPQDRTDFIVLCSVLHDIGKIATPDSILFKRGSLDESEWEVMRDHAAAGQRILSQIPSLERCAIIVRAHHERWDGAGYPDNLAGENIPFEARVLAVADAFHAMISERPYRKARPARQALEVLREGRGTQWDPIVVDAMLSLFERSRRTDVAKAATA